MSVDSECDYNINVDGYAGQLRVSCPTLKRLKIYIEQDEEVKQLSWMEAREFEETVLGGSGGRI